MKIAGFVWFEDIVQKLIWKHSIEAEEVREIFLNNPRFRFVEKGHRKDENIYAAYGQKDAGRYLVCYFVHKKGQSRSCFISKRYDRLGEKKIWQKIKVQFQKQVLIKKSASIGTRTI